jgi:Uma2 family endonuclease
MIARFTALALVILVYPLTAAADDRDEVIRPGVYHGVWHTDKVKIIIEEVDRDGTFSGQLKFDKESRFPDFHLPRGDTESAARRSAGCLGILPTHHATQTGGWVTSNDTGVILERAPDTVRGPDVAFWSITRQPTIPEGYFEIPPDLAVEVLSPDDRRKDVRAKIKEYLFYGVKLVWLVDPETRIVTVYRESPRGVELDEDDLLDCGEILPGFTCKVSDLFG